jgi:hypothetical protein
MSVTVTTRAEKGSALTWQEVDDNFTDLNNAIVCYVQDAQPTFPLGQKAFWVQTNVNGDPESFTFWVNT